jgi:hypothetical protein
MAKTKPALPVAESAIEDFVSLKDAAYKQAFAGDKAESMVLSTARYTRLHHPNWPHEKDESSRQSADRRLLASVCRD